eukprot:CAMPEP_0197629160 /NCGR_PEP_ID=MMETSP1338-20131121/7136_1 /TAXON_ID=43686 ORGANISM="Pelagodinium beii, Strain RCC1491" /NCGR_SAMPLE_ID=MMETSP1338 /ASSEMBLY_ACC=CAM_ASM_000754 /LENGTH=356 /DNA_ID=CAMNT_0043200181 /DNA_START=43 /DNA_END=1111 /DNA_ORIENTATION=+
MAQSAFFLLSVACLAGRICSANEVVKVKYIDANAMKCPTLTNMTVPLVYASCRNHGMDIVACGVSEMVVDFTCLLLVTSIVYVGMMYKRMVTRDALDKQDAMEFYRDPDDSRPLMLSRSSSSSSQAPTLLSSRADFSQYVHGHRQDTGKFMHAHLGHLVSKHDDMGDKIEAIEKSEAFWTAFGQMLGLLNLTIPSVSIVMQGVLKVGDNGHHAGKGEYKEGGNIDYRDYDLDECARAYRQGCVAVFTITAIILQSISKTFKPDTKAGELAELKRRLKKQKEQFEDDLMSVGGKKGGEGDGHGEASDPLSFGPGSLDSSRPQHKSSMTRPGQMSDHWSIVWHNCNHNTSVWRQEVEQ